MLSDLWWMGKEEVKRFHFLRITRHEPEDIRCHPSDSAFLETAGDVVEISEVEEYYKNRGRVNIHRSMTVPCCQQSGAEGISGPQLLDIDLHDPEANELSDLREALVVCRHIVQPTLLETLGFGHDEVRVFFSGKGFHVEVIPSAVARLLKLPQPLKLTELKEQQHKFRDRVLCMLECAGWRREGNIVEGTWGRVVLDKMHCYLRLHGSVNRWYVAGSRVSRRTIPVSITELQTVSVEAILQGSLVLD